MKNNDVEKVVEAIVKKLQEKLPEIVKEALEEVYGTNMGKVSNIVDFIDWKDIKYKVIISPTKQKDKIVVYLYKAGKKVDVIGEIVLIGDVYRFYPYDNRLRKVCRKEELDYNYVLTKMDEIVEKYKDKIQEIVSSGVSIRVIETIKTEESIPEEPSKVNEAIKRVQEEMKAWMEEHGKEYVPENVVRRLLRKYGLSMEDFIRFVDEFYEKEKGKWYPI